MFFRRRASLKRNALVPRDDYTKAMGQHFSSVCVIATKKSGKRYGLTATAVSSVCADPPRLLICVNQSGLTHKKIEKAGHFCVNVLGDQQDDVAKVFAGMTNEEGDRFSCGEWGELVTGSPALIGASACFDCIIAEQIKQFSHTIFIANVVGVSVQVEQDSLLYGARGFRTMNKAF